MNKKYIEKLKKIDLTVFGKKLHDLAINGKLIPSMNDITYQEYNELIPTTISETELQSLYQGVKKASKVKRIRDAKTHLTTNLAFGRLLQFLRDKSGLTQIDIAKLLGKDKSYIENLESCRINPLKMPISDLVDILDLFQIRLSKFVLAAKESLILLSTKTNTESAMARSPIKAGTKEREESLSHAMDSVLLEIEKKKGQCRQNKAEIDNKFLEELRKELIKRGNNDLLK